MDCLLLQSGVALDITQPKRVLQSSERKREEEGVGRLVSRRWPQVEVRPALMFSGMRHQQLPALPEILTRNDLRSTPTRDVHF